MKLDQNGTLWLLRTGQWKMQYCPYSMRGNACGDWCTQFGDPELTTMQDGTTHVQISVCQNTNLVVLKTDFVDERKE